MQVKLTAETQAALETLLQNGWYTSAEQIIQIGVEHLLYEEPNNARLRRLVEEGIDSLAKEPVVTREQLLQHLDERRRKRA